MRTDNLKIIAEILSAIEKQPDERHIDWSKFNHIALNMTQARWVRLMEMLADGGLIAGFSYAGNADEPNLGIQHLRLTFKGLEVAEEAKKGHLDLAKFL